MRADMSPSRAAGVSTRVRDCSAGKCCTTAGRKVPVRAAPLNVRLCRRSPQADARADTSAAPSWACASQTIECFCTNLKLRPAVKQRLACWMWVKQATSYNRQLVAVTSKWGWKLMMMGTPAPQRGSLPQHCCHAPRAPCTPAPQGGSLLHRCHLLSCTSQLQCPGSHQGIMLVVHLNYLIVVPSPVMSAQAASGASAWKSA
jgi:hypothetical protein